MESVSVWYMIEAMGYVVARWWTFGNPFAPCRDLLELLHDLSGAEDDRMSTLTFDGRRFISGRFDGLDDIRRESFPPHFCEADIRSPQARPGERQPPETFAMTLSVSPLARLWADVTKRASKNRRDRAGAMSFRSLQSHARLNRIRAMPHLLQGWAVPPRGRSRAKQLDEVVRRLRSLLPRHAGLMGGFDFVSRFMEMGSYDIASVVATLPPRWDQLKTRFDDMHKVMFGPRRMFEPLPADEARHSFEGMETIASESRRQILAIARTGSSMRRFAREASELIVQ